MVKSASSSASNLAALRKAFASLALAAFALTSTLGGAAPASASPTTSEDCFTWTTSGSSATLTGLAAGAASSCKTDVIIPSTYTLNSTSYSVTSIGLAALKQKGLTGSLTIPSSVTSIENNAFQTNSLTSVSIPTSVTTIGLSVFAANSLTWLTIPSSVTSISNGAFQSNLLTSVSIPDSVTSIGGYAFQSNLLTSVSIPSSVTTISPNAFQTNFLTSVSIPSSVTSIGSSAFQSNSLTSVSIPSSVTSIGVNAFQSNLLTSVSIPRSVTSIGNGVFQSNLLTSVSIPSSVTSIGPNAFKSNSLTSVSIPSSVTSIGNGAFQTNFLTSVSIPSSVTTISPNAFRSNLLTSVSFAGNAPTDVASVFTSNTELTKVDVLASTTGWGSTWSGVTVNKNKLPDAPSISSFTAGNSQATVSFTAPSDTGGSELTDYLVEYKASSDGSWSTFSHDASASTLSYTITGLSNGTSYDVRISAVNAYLGTGTASSISTATPQLPVTVPGAPTVTSLTAGNASATVTFTAPSSDGGSAVTDYVVEYKASADSSWSTFSHDASASTLTYTITGLTNGTSYDVRVSAINSVGTGTASSVSSLTPATTPDAPTVDSVTAGDSQVTINFTAPVSDGGLAITGYEYSLDDGFTWISGGTTYSPIVITGLTNGTAYSVKLRAVNGAGAGSANAAVDATPVAPETFTYTVDSNGKATVTGCVGTCPVDLVIPGTLGGNPVTTIGELAFADAGLTSVSIPDSVVTVGYKAFQNDHLSSIVLPTSLTTIEPWAFSFNSLTSVAFPSSLTSLGAYAMYSNPLTSATFLGNAPTEADGQFALTSLTAVDVAYGTTGWGSTFSGVTVRVGSDPNAPVGGFTYTTDADNNVTITGYTGTVPADLVIPGRIDDNPVTAIGYEAFRGKDLSSVTIPSSVTDIGAWSFAQNALASLTIPDSVTSVGLAAFYGNNLLSSLTLGSSVTSIDPYAFQSSALTSVTLPASLTSIGSWVFADNALTSVVFEGNAPIATEGETTFYNNDSLVAVDVAYGTTGWGATFSGVPVRVGPAPFTYTTDESNNVTVTGCIGACPADLVIPATLGGNPVTAIGDNAFKSADLTSVVFPGSLVSIGYWAFEHNSLTSVTLPTSLTTLHAGAFYINSLTSVEVPSGVATVEDYVFAKNTPLATVTFKGDAPAEGNNVFENDPDLTAVDVAYGSSGWGSTFAGVPVNVVGGPTQPPAPVGKPASAPKIRAVKAGNARVTITYLAPKKNGGSAVTGYEYTVNDGATWVPVQPNDISANSLRIFSLGNGTRYTIRIRAVNAAGGGAASNARAFTPRTVASAPTNVVLSTRSGRIKVDFDAPASNGGAAITRYGYSINGRPVQNFGSTSTSQWIKNLPNNVTYTVQIMALNAAGWGPASSAVEATPHK